MKMESFIDVSHAPHITCHSHTGFINTFGPGTGGAFMAESSKQKIVTTSSTEGELVGLSDKSKKVIWEDYI